MAFWHSSRWNGVMEYLGIDVSAAKGEAPHKDSFDKKAWAATRPGAWRKRLVPGYLVYEITYWFVIFFFPNYRIVQAANLAAIFATSWLLLRYVANKMVAVSRREAIRLAYLSHIAFWAMIMAPVFLVLGLLINLITDFIWR